MISTVLTVMKYIFIIFAAASVVKIVIAKNRSEKLIALMILSSVILALLALIAVDSDQIFILDVALVYDIFGFLGLLAIARFLPQVRHKKDREESHDS
ncbi:MAG: monovalent cation/H+ antiporter complex subunit F [Sphaerochaetaceae bacterium]|nr:monovalent cation/H+ antiporter complex subunit F [Sphaerochaetaceae bacterium]